MFGKKKKVQQSQKRVPRTHHLDLGLFTSQIVAKLRAAELGGTGHGTLSITETQWAQYTRGGLGQGDEALEDLAAFSKNERPPF